MEIYKEVIYDLLSLQISDLKIQENQDSDFIIDGLNETFIYNQLIF